MRAIQIVSSYLSSEEKARLGPSEHAVLGILGSHSWHGKAKEEETPAAMAGITLHKPAVRAPSATNPENLPPTCSGTVSLWRPGK
jgi:hypothetical protein